ncbi:MAG: AlwI family type II restriction endonuclease [Clostridia bacterium]|nr:AlwI family type II restriction endonuclease [Clostridia bacterium]
MNMLWSMSTTVREAERIIGFLKTAIELDGQIWNKENQEKFQVLLIKNRQYLNDPDNRQSFNKLSDKQAQILKDKSIDMTYEQARGIFDTKEYNDPPMRGRQSMAPLTKLGLVYIVGDNKTISVTDVGYKLANGEIAFADFMLDALLKFQYPNPYEKGFRDWNTKPFINTLRLIKTVDEKCIEQGIKAKGISRLEFGIFALSMKSYESVENVAEKILDFRKNYENITDDEAKDEFVKAYINEYLSDFQNPEKNVKEYTDNMIRYLRLTRYIYIRGKYSNTYIDLEPRRATEINSILETDSGCAVSYTKDDWRAYMGVYGTYELPFETIDKLTEIAFNTITEINSIEAKLGINNTKITIAKTKNVIKQQIEELRLYRTKLQNLEIKQDYNTDIAKIDEAISALEDIRKRNKASLNKKFSIELEKWSNVALNIINDAVLIKPNSPVGDDNEPIYTAPNGVPDIECYYDAFGAICEVTMLTSRDQWYNEGQPVKRHLRQFELENADKQSYCLFVAPSLHVDTINTFYMSVKYEYDGKAQKILPITIVQLENILLTIKELSMQGKKFKHSYMQELYESCTNITNVNNSSAWLEYISNELCAWKTRLVG